jgi:hypothetical protein
MGLHFLEDMNTTQVKELREKTHLAIIPVGPTEVHDYERNMHCCGCNSVAFAPGRCISLDPATGTSLATESAGILLAQQSFIFYQKTKYSAMRRIMPA